MKTQSDFLFRLIRSLNASEKRYFTLYASRHVLGQKNNYLKLFEVIEKQTEYDENQVKAELKEEAMVRHFSATKTRLKDMILDALDDYERNNSPQEQLKKQLHQVKLLALKGFKKEAIQLLEKVQKKAVLSDFLEIALLAVKFKVPLLGISNIDLDGYAKEEKHYIDLLQHQGEYNLLHYKTYQLIYQWSALHSDESRKALEEIMQHSLLKDENQALTFRAKMQYYDIQSSYYNRVIQDIPLSYSYQKSYIRLLESHEERLRLTPNIYYIGVFNFLNACGKLKKYEEIIERLKDLKVAAKKYGFSKLADFQKYYFSNNYTLLFGIYHATKQINKGLDLIPEVIEGLQKYDVVIRLSAKIHIYRFITFFYFVNGELSNALTWADAILNEKSDAIPQEFRSLARIFQVLVHYQWSNDNYVIGLIRSYQRHLKKMEVSFQVEITLLKAINRLAKLIDKDRKNKVLEKLKMDLSELEEKHSSELSVLNFFPYLQWVKAQVEERDLKEVFEEDFRP